MTITARAVADRNENRILLAARMVREHYFGDRRKDRPDWILIFAIREFLDRRPNATPEDLYDLLITQSRIKTDGHLSRYVAASLAADAALVCKTSSSPTINVFTGARRFSFSKLSAMSAFIALHGVKVSRQKLGHLLFYGDFVHFFLHGQSISGARYVRRPFGPLMHKYETLLKTMVYSGVVRLENHYDDEAAIRREQMILGELTIHETVTMHWVLANLGSMTGPEISQYTHREIAHRFTRQDGFIAYEYARILQNLPDRSML